MLTSQILTEIQALGFGTDTAVPQLAFVNDRYRSVNSQRRWPWTEAFGTINTVAGVSTVSLSSLADLNNIDSIRVITPAGSSRNLVYINAEDLLDRINEALAAPFRSQPEYWTRVDSNIYLYPMPDAVYGLSLKYKKILADLTVSPDLTPAWPSDYHDILKWGAAATLAARERDWDAAANFENMFQSRLLEMKREVNMQQRQTDDEVDMSYWDGEIRGFR